MCGEHPERGTCDESRPVPRFLASATMLFEDIGNVGAVIHNALVPPPGTVAGIEGRINKPPRLLNGEQGVINNGPYIPQLLGR